jgi:hypothetical protein
MADFKVGHVERRVYRDRNGKVIDGFAVRVVIPEFDEEPEINVPSMDPETVREAIVNYLDNRRALAALGE